MGSWLKDSLRVLVTGAGAPGIRGTLYALRNNPDGVPVTCIGTDLRTGTIGSFLVDRFHPVPAPESPEYLPAMQEVCRRESVDIILPQTTRELAPLSRGRDSLLAQGVRVAISGSKAIEHANDKFRLLEAFRALRLPIPEFRLARDERGLAEAARELGYPNVPVIVKPPCSNGMRGFRVLREQAWNAARFLAEKPSGTEIALSELVAILRRGDTWPELLVSEYLPGAEYSVDGFLGEKAAVAVPRLREAIRSGISFNTRIEPREDLIRYTLDGARALGLRYAFGFQFKLDAGGTPKVLECNPRVQGTMVASVFAGANVIWLGIKEAFAPVEMAEIPDTLRPASFLRFWGGVGVSEGAAIDVI